MMIDGNGSRREKIAPIFVRATVGVLMMAG
jgi:hypothetical protein